MAYRIDPDMWKGLTGIGAGTAGAVSAVYDAEMREYQRKYMEAMSESMNRTMPPTWIAVNPAAPSAEEVAKAKAIAEQEARSAEFANKPLPEYAEVEPLEKFLKDIEERDAARNMSPASVKSLNSMAACFGWVRPK